VAEELARGEISIEPGKSKLVATRKDVERGWQAVSNILVRQGESELAAEVKRYVRDMEPPLTEKEQLAVGLLRKVRDREPSERPPTR
jgi:hypothetical protein